jgi:proteasome lid subunit RPN8/RPN11
MQLSQDHVDAIIGHCRAGLPDEACGIVAGAGDRATAVFCLENARRSPFEYALPAGGYLLVADLDEAGRLLACFHSHPQGAAYPSPTDRRNAFWPIRYIIVSLAGVQPTVRAFRMTKRDAFDPHELAEVSEEKVEIA